jgi:D-arginine dehydrogenase
LARHAKVTLLEAEEQVGFHSSGRSATMLHYALGDRLVRSLTFASRSFFDAPPDEFSKVPLSHRMSVLVFAQEDERVALDGLEAQVGAFASVDRLDEAGLRALCPMLRTGESGARHGIADHDGLRLDPHAMLQGFVGQLRERSGTLCTGSRLRSANYRSSRWVITTEQGEEYHAPILVNAAGAWADRVATSAGVRPIGLRPLRRTIITFDAPPGADLRKLPFAKTIGDELYFAPESGRMFASPMDEVESQPCDAQPDELEVALAAHRVEQRTTMSVARIQSRWAGLRTFAPDRHPVIGFAPDAEGFFWLAGQGGAGLQTAPATAAVVASLIAGDPWPIQDIAAEQLSPDRFHA